MRNATTLHPSPLRPEPLGYPGRRGEPALHRVVSLLANVTGRTVRAAHPGTPASEATENCVTVRAAHPGAPEIEATENCILSQRRA